ncbi:hypothetical protein L0222_23605 [bacterium]|nr:hypothetical protein [bacterium]MCI0607357.1 hypothetical protein [bacterium]
MLVFLGIAQVHRWKAEWNLLRGVSPEKEILKGLEPAKKALSMDPQAAEAIATEAALHLLQSRSERDPEKRDAAKALARAKIEKAIQINRLLPKEYHSLSKSVEF